MPGTDLLDIDAAHASGKQLLEQTGRQLFFIVGCGRSGTSLLQSMISAHPKAILPNETGFYTMIYKRHRRLHRVRSEADFQRVIDVVLDHLRVRTMQLDPQQVRDLCQHGERSWETVFLALLASYAIKHGRRRIGEKSPRHVRVLGYLTKRFPEARFIHMIRDPRAVALSASKTEFGGPFTARHVSTWSYAINAHRQYGDVLGPKRYLVVHYEDLVTDQEHWIRGVCEFLELPFDDAMLAHHQRQEKGFGKWQQGHMANTLKPVFTTSVDKWRRNLSPRRIALIEHDLGERITDMGYELTGQRTPLPALQLNASRVGLFIWRIYQKVLRTVGLSSKDTAQD